MVRNVSSTIYLSCNLTPAISQVLIGKHLIFCLPMWPKCCNSPWKCTPVKYKARQKAGFYNQMLGGKRVREENQLSHTVNNLKICSLLVVSRLFLLVVSKVQIVVGCALLDVGRFRSFLARCRLFQIVVDRSRSFQVVPCFSKYQYIVIFHASTGNYNVNKA